MYKVRVIQDDGVFGAFLPEFPFIVAYGKSYIEARNKLCTAIVDLAFDKLNPIVERTKNRIEEDYQAQKRYGRKPKIDI